MLSLIHELWLFIRARRKFVLLPLILVMLILGSMMLFAQTAAAPFIYALF